MILACGFIKSTILSLLSLTHISLLLSFMDKLRGVESLPVVLHRFSNGVEVVKCVVEFCNEVAILERSYSESLHRLLRSSSYTFHSNLLFQWLGNDPYEEIGSLKHCWQELGQELCKLADLHSEQAEAYQNTVRKPLIDLLPHLEEARKNMRVKMLQVKANLELANKKMSKERQKYVGLGESCDRLQSQIKSMQITGITAKMRLARIEKKLDSTEKQLHEQQQIYQTSHSHYQQLLRQCNEEIQELYRKHNERELNRVNSLKESLLGFTKVLSNTAPAYLEGMKRIQISVDKIDAASDVQWFINEHTDLQATPQPPKLEKYSFERDSSTREGGRRSPIGGEGKEDTPSQNHKGKGREKSSDTSSESDHTPSDHTPSGAHGPLDSPQDLPEDEEDMASARGKKSLRKWPLEGFWGGIKGRLRPGETRADRGEEGDNSDSGDRVTKTDGETERVSGSSRDDNWREENSEEEDAHSQHSNFSGSVRRMESSDEREISSSADGGAGRAMGSQQAWRGRGKKARDSLRPAPKPKPASLKVSRELGSSSDSEGVRFSSTRDGSSKVVGLEAELEGPIPRKLRPQRAAKPQLRPKQPNQHQTTQTKEPTRQMRPPQSEGTSGHEQPVAIPIASGSSRHLPSHHSPKSRAEIHSPRTPTATSPLAVRFDDSVDASIGQMVSRLREHVAENDYYQLFGVDPTTTGEDLARVRREKSRQLHPDHFANQPEKQERAQQQLMLINQVFQDVLKNIETRSLYNQLCQFRQHYGRIPFQKQRGLQVAHSKLESLHKQLKKRRVPLPLLNELQTALQLITACQLEKQA